MGTVERGAWAWSWGTGVPTLLPPPVSLQFRLRNHDTPLTLTRRGLVLVPAGGFDPSNDTQVGTSVLRLSQPHLGMPGLSPSLVLPAGLHVLLFPSGSRLPPAPGMLQPCLCPKLHPLLHLESCPSPHPCPYSCPHSGLQLVLIFISTPLPIPVPAPTPILIPVPLPFPVSVPVPVPILSLFLSLYLLLSSSLSLSLSPPLSPSLSLVPLGAVSRPPRRCPADFQAGDRGDGPPRAQLQRGREGGGAAIAPSPCHLPVSGAGPGRGCWWQQAMRRCLPCLQRAAVGRDGAGGHRPLRSGHAGSCQW